MDFYIPGWLVLMVAGYCFGRAIEALFKFLRYLDRETRGPFKKG